MGENKKKKSKQNENSDKYDKRTIGCCSVFLAVTSVLLAFLAYQAYAVITFIPDLPPVDLETWWGPDHTRNTQDTSIRPFRIVFTDAMHDQLVKKFEMYKRVNIKKSFEDTAWRYGVHSEAVEEVFSHWQFKYPFRERQRFLNQYEHFKTNIQGLDIHFIHEKPKVEGDVKVLPILLMHGWPGSIREFYELIPLLTTPRPRYDFVFEVIVPSLPGFGFSKGAVKPGLSPYTIGVVMNNLMKRLGFPKYYIQGGNFGHMIGTNMATLFPDNVLGFHTNMPFMMSRPYLVGAMLGAIWPTLVEPNYPERMYPLGDKIAFQIEESGYNHIQSTKPDTIGIALQDSPVGLAAYILERIMVNTDPNNKLLTDGGFSKYYNMTDLIDNIMVYWVSGSITTSMRIYKEYSNVEVITEQIPTPVPTWVLNLKHEQFYSPEFLLRWKYPNLKGTTTHDFGGHFAAFERPEELADDVFLAVKAFRQ